MELKHILEKAVENSASDVHLSVGIPPVLRIHGELRALEFPPLTAEDCLNMAKECLSSKMRETFLELGEVDSSYGVSNVGRFRVNVFKQRGSCALVFRIVPSEIPKFDSLGLSPVIKEFANKKRGLVLVTGATGSGKSTTLASLINHINETRRNHIITIEDPIEFLHKHKKSIINQREIGTETKSFSNSLRSALREDPDVILVGEMRDPETISIALTAAETGHLVFSTLHTVGAAKTIDRILDSFPTSQQPQVRSQMSTVLQGIVSQQLLTKSDEKGRVVATEVMVLTSAISNLIREGKTYQINTCIHTGMQYGMHSMDSSIAKLYREKEIDFDTAIQYAIDPENLKKILSI